jgi:hypothetical protein
VAHRVRLVRHFASAMAALGVCAWPKSATARALGERRGYSVKQLMGKRFENEDSIRVTADNIRAAIRVKRGYESLMPLRHDM